jgi:hypothetical protein
MGFRLKRKHIYNFWTQIDLIFYISLKSWREKYIQIFYNKVTKCISRHNNVEGTGRRTRGRKQLAVDINEKEKVPEIQRESTSSQFVGR